MRLWVGNPEVWTLGVIPWQFFCSLTFNGIRLANPSHRAGVVRVTMWFALWRRLCRQFGIADRRLLWALRQEAGEVGGRMHLHALIGGVPESLVNSRTCFWLRDRWVDEIGGGKMSRVRVVDNAIAGVDYTFKGLLDVKLSGANFYESSKFRDADRVMVSKSVFLYLSALDRRTWRTAN